MLVTLSIKGNIMLRFLALIFLTCLTFGAMALQVALSALAVMGAGAAWIVCVTLLAILKFIRKFKGA